MRTRLAETKHHSAHIFYTRTPAIHPQARSIILMAFGENKAAVVREAVEGPMSDRVAASYLQRHPDARFMLDYAAAAGGNPFSSQPIGFLCEQRCELLGGGLLPVAPPGCSVHGPTTLHRQDGCGIIYKSNGNNQFHFPASPDCHGPS